MSRRGARSLGHDRSVHDRRPGETRFDLVVTTAFLASGFGLIVFVLFGFSLPASLAVGWSGIAAGAWWFERTASADARGRFHEVLRVGAVAGLAGTVAYDASRWSLVNLFDLHLNPFGAFGAFGDALVPGSDRQGWARVVGLGYHLVNGVSFGIAYTGLFRRRGALAGVAFGLGLEACMLAIYPGWLDIDARREFTQMSVFGHVFYGATLGLVARRLLAHDAAPVST